MPPSGTCCGRQVLFSTRLKPFAIALAKGCLTERALIFVEGRWSSHSATAGGGEANGPEGDSWTIPTHSSGGGSSSTLIARAALGGSAALWVGNGRWKSWSVTDASSAWTVSESANCPKAFVLRRLKESAGPKPPAFSIWHSRSTRNESVSRASVCPNCARRFVCSSQRRLQAASSCCESKAGTALHRNGTRTSEADMFGVRIDAEAER